MNLHFTHEDFNELDSFFLFNSSDNLMDEMMKETPSLNNTLETVSESKGQDLSAENNDLLNNWIDQAFGCEANLEDCSFCPDTIDFEFSMSSVDLLREVSEINLPNLDCEFGNIEKSDDLKQLNVNLNENPKSVKLKKRNLKKNFTQKTKKQKTFFSLKKNKPTIVSTSTSNPTTASASTSTVSKMQEPDSRKTSNTTRMDTFPRQTNISNDSNKMNNLRSTRSTRSARSTRSTRSTRSDRSRYASTKKKKKYNSNRNTNCSTRNKKTQKYLNSASNQNQKKINRPSDITVAFDLNSDFSNQILSIEDLDWVLVEARRFLKRHSTISESLMKEDERILLRKMNKTELVNLSSEQRLQRKRARDRVCARNARNKKKKYTDFLEKQVGIIKSDNIKVENKLGGLVDENYQLKNEISKLKNCFDHEKLQSLLNLQNKRKKFTFDVNLAAALLKNEQN
ncbi:transcriptional activator hac1 [Anaeramoeba flamelloides]|uniref:Transcriptional activator hac1 n=1 Tax=Anaeramoeba flamelloides TaxID=1746091 RepID=A0AAV7YLK0_9EUKA|nr:transcriptional activator hac1 [Anaeramoeba flamelloides]